MEKMIVTDKVREVKKTIRTILDYLESKGIKDGEESMLLQIEIKI